MSVPVLLAHGALGNFDELIFLGIVVVLLALMAISWIRSATSQPDSSDASEATPPDEAQERFKLD